tara:strand:+ start:10360 stop:11187 length:828 start_codon:yes stop_codon:yes gene_type:complete
MRKIILLSIIILFTSAVQQDLSEPIDLWHWKLELPTGYKASDWKLSNYEKDSFAKPFFRLDQLSNELVMDAYPSIGSSKSKYTRNTLREQIQPGSNDVNWTMKEEGILNAEFRVTSVSKNSLGEYHRIVLLQVDGRTTQKQTRQLGLKKPMSMPMIKIYWQDGFLRVTRRVLKDEGTVGDALLSKSSWKEDRGVFSEHKVDFNATKVSLSCKRGKVTVQINEEPLIVFRDLSVSQWYFENYFTVGNYLQSKEPNCFSSVAYSKIDVSHAKLKYKP